MVPERRGPQRSYHTKASSTCLAVSVFEVLSCKQLCCIQRQHMISSRRQNKISAYPLRSNSGQKVRNPFSKYPQRNHKPQTHTEQKTQEETRQSISASERVADSTVTDSFASTVGRFSAAHCPLSFDSRATPF